MARRRPRYFTVDEALSVALGELDLDFVGEELDEDCGSETNEESSADEGHEVGNVGGGQRRRRFVPLEAESDDDAGDFL